jgi:peptidyl-prolyl cis-trans isomerase SurA
LKIYRLSMGTSRRKEHNMKIFRAVLAGAAFLLLCVPAQAGVADRIVAVVNDEVITLSELNGAFEPFRTKLEVSYSGAEREKALTETKLTLLNQMIDNLLMQQQGRKVGISIKDEEVTSAINDLLARRNISQEDFRKAVAREGTTQEAYRKNVKDQMMRIRLVQREIKSKVAISSEEIGEYYRKNRQDYEGKEAVRIKQILLLLPKEASDEAKAKLRADAGAIHKRLLDGEPFELVSARYSQGPAAAMGGDIGYIEKGMMLPEVESVAYSLPLNQISAVIESFVGFHIVQVIDRRGAGVKPIESVREEIREKLEMEKVEKKFDEWLEALRAKSHIEIKL